jgi:hypothetical protein
MFPGYNFQIASKDFCIFIRLYKLGDSFGNPNSFSTQQALLYSEVTSPKPTLIVLNTRNLRTTVMKTILLLNVMFCGAPLSISAALEIPKEDTVIGASIVYNSRVIILQKDVAFGLSLENEHSAILSILYQPDSKKADVILKFSREAQADGTSKMTLYIHNNLNQALEMDATCEISDMKHLSIPSGISEFALWPSTYGEIDIRNVCFAK